MWLYGVGIKNVVVDVMVWVWVGAGCGRVESGLGVQFVLYVGATVRGLVVLVIVGLWDWVSLVGFASVTSKCDRP